MGIGRVGPLMVALCVTACASAPRPGVRHDRVITSTELAATSHRTIYDAIDGLRPAWLGAEPVERGIRTTQPSVYMNRLYLGDATQLERVRVRDVVEVRLISPSLALDRYGSEHPAGVIEVVTRDVGAF